MRKVIVVGLVLRIVPMLIWPTGCTRDECTYQGLADQILAGNGLVAAPNGWVWAPGYPYLLALCKLIFFHTYGAKAIQVALYPLGAWLMWQITNRSFAPDDLANGRPGKVAAWLFALHPTLAYYTGQIWSEALYTIILLGAVWGLLRSRERSWRAATLPGALIGLCVLFRGVATYMAPIFAVAAVWPRPGEGPVAAFRARWRHACALVLTAVVVVAPYSLHASNKHGGFLISDATLGQMMWLGNNVFEPITFDYGNGLLNHRVYSAHTEGGRPHCDASLPPAEWNACEVDNGKEWIAANPEEFLHRVPLRLAQLLNPHTFLTRHIRWGKWPFLPWIAKEGIIIYVALWSGLVLIGGTIAVWARGRGTYLLLAAGIVGYHVAAIALLAGLSRYRLPLEPLWMVFLAVGIAEPKATLRGLRHPLRALGALVCLAALIPLMLWFLPAGFPGYW